MPKHKLTAGQKKKGLRLAGWATATFESTGRENEVLYHSHAWVGQTTCTCVPWGCGWAGSSTQTEAHVHPHSAAQRVPRGWHRPCPLLRCEPGPPQERDSPHRQDNWVHCGRLHVGQQGCRRDHTAPVLKAVRTDRATSLPEKRALPHPVLQAGIATQGKTSPLPAPALPQTHFASWAPHRGFCSLHKPFPYLPHHSEDMHACHQPSQLFPTL